MPRYTIIQQNDNKFYMITEVEGKGTTSPTAPTRTVGAGQNTLAQAQALLVAAVLADTGWSEVVT